MDYKQTKLVYKPSPTTTVPLLQDKKEAVHLSSTSIQIVPSRAHNTTSIAWRCGSKSAGSLNVNSITVLLGAIGTGKSTLLKLLAGQERHRSSTVFFNSNYRQAVIFIDGTRSSMDFKLSNLTVRQTLQYCFNLANSCTQMGEMDGHIDRLLDDWAVDRRLLGRKICRLEESDRLQLAVVCQFTAIRRRPIFLVLDHVFDHLNNLAATSMLKQLRAQTETSTPVTVVFSASYLDGNLILFHCHQLIVLEASGRVLYSGKPSKVGNFLQEKCLLQGQVHDEKDAVEKILQIASSSSETISTVTEKLYQKSSEELSIQTASFKKSPSFKRKYFNLNDLAILIARELSTFSFGKFFALNCVTAVAMFILSSLFFSEKMAEINGCQSLEKKYQNLSDKEFIAFTEEALLVEENVGFLVFLALSSGYLVLITSVLNSTAKLQPFEQEHQNNWYSLGAWFWSHIFLTTMTTIVFAFTTSTSAFFASSQPLSISKLFSYILLMCIFLQYANLAGQLIAFSMPKSSNLVLSSTILFTAIFLLNDYFVVTSTLGTFLQTISDYLATKYFVHSLLSIFYSDRCPEESYSWLLESYGGINASRPLSFALNRLCTNIILLQVINLIVLFCRFGTLVPRQYTTQPELSKDENDNESKMSSSNDDEIEYEKVKSPEQLQFDTWLKSPPKMSIHWRNLTVLDKQQKIILCDLSGQLHFGEVHAIVGNSTFKMTTLLKTLSSRLGANHHLTKESKVYLSKFMQMDTCFVDQSLLKSPTHHNLTVEQYLCFISALKNCNQTASKMIVGKMLEEMDLHRLATQMMGQCSVGEQKLVTIIASLLSLQLPRLIFIDGLFSGIDSFTQFKLIALLKKTAKQHSSTILTSLSSTSTAALLTSFDSVTILSCEGACTYRGAATELADSRHHLLPPSEACSTVETLEGDDMMNVELRSVAQNRTRFTLDSLCVLLHRRLSTFMLKPTSSLFLPLTLYLLYGSLLRLAFPIEHITSASGCFDIEQPLASMAAQRSSLRSNLTFDLFAYVLPLLFMALQSGLSLAAAAQGHFVADRQAGLYSSGVFYCAITAEETLLALATTLLYSLLVSADRYVDTVLLQLLAIMAVQPMATIIAVLARYDATVTALTTVATLLATMLLGGLLRPLASLHYSLQWLANTTAARFVFESHLLRQYGFGRCTDGQIQMVLFAKQLDEGDYWTNVAMLLGNALAWRLFAMLVLIIQMKWMAGGGNTTSTDGPPSLGEPSACASSSAPTIPGLDCSSLPHTSFTMRVRQFSNV